MTNPLRRGDGMESEHHPAEEIMREALRRSSSGTVPTEANNDTAGDAWDSEYIASLEDGGVPVEHRGDGPTLARLGGFLASPAYPSARVSAGAGGGAPTPFRRWRPLLAIAAVLF